MSQLRVPNSESRRVKFSDENESSMYVKSVLFDDAKLETPSYKGTYRNNNLRNSFTSPVSKNSHQGATSNDNTREVLAPLLNSNNKQQQRHTSGAGSQTDTSSSSRPSFSDRFNATSVGQTPGAFRSRPQSSPHTTPSSGPPTQSLLASSMLKKKASVGNSSNSSSSSSSSSGGVITPTGVNSHRKGSSIGASALANEKSPYLQSRSTHSTPLPQSTSDKEEHSDIGSGGNGECCRGNDMEEDPDSISSSSSSSSSSPHIVTPMRLRNRHSGVNKNNGRNDAGYKRVLLYGSEPASAVSSTPTVRIEPRVADDIMLHNYIRRHKGDEESDSDDEEDDGIIDIATATTSLNTKQYSSAKGTLNKGKHIKKSICNQIMEFFFSF